MSTVIEFKRKPPQDNFQKVCLPGEFLWVNVKSISPGGVMTGTIANNPVNTDWHHYEYGDTARFVWCEEPAESDLWAWLPILEPHFRAEKSNKNNGGAR